MELSNKTYEGLILLENKQNKQNSQTIQNKLSKIISDKVDKDLVKDNDKKVI